MNTKMFIDANLKPVLAKLFTQAQFALEFPKYRHSADLIFKVGKIPFAAEILLSRSSAHFNEKIGRLQAYAAPGTMIPVLIAPAISPQRQEMLKKKGICFMDTIGNTWIKAPGIYIDRISKERNVLRGEEIYNPFSDKSSLILRIMMESPEKYWGNNEIAQKAGINAGWVSQVCHRLEELRYVARSGDRRLKIVRPQDILNDWVEFYRQKKQKMHYFYYPTDDLRNIMERLKTHPFLKKHKWAYSYHAGASLAAPHAKFREVHAYVDGLAAHIETWKNESGLVGSQRGENNLVLIDPYYKTSYCYGIQRIKDFPVVSDIQLYLDLKTYPIRGEEQAQHLFEKRIAPKWRI
ncbi:type IV toxin-antitoxin system AbiEi family antitoxin [Elusimicrobiota bacterium]